MSVEDEMETRPDGPTREEVDAMEGPVLLEFGTEWCGHCRTLAPRLAEILEAHPTVKHLKVEDGPGLPLGRSFGVKLWPTLVFLRDGRALLQASRPGPGEIRRGIEAITGKGPPVQSGNP